ncbi:MAG: ATP-binding protein, partial [Candidatus Limnocylindrus sp.]
ATGNPCGCGELESQSGACLCTPRARRHGSLSLSAPIRDRFALRVRLGRPVAPISTLPSGRITTAVAREAVTAALEVAPSTVESVKRADALLLRTYARMHADRISGRGWSHICAVAAAGALLSGRETFGEEELAEALHLVGVH